jgi:hypothetical protein
LRWRSNPGEDYLQADPDDDGGKEEEEETTMQNEEPIARITTHKAIQTPPRIGRTTANAGRKRMMTSETKVAMARPLATLIGQYIAFRAIVTLPVPELVGWCCRLVAYLIWLIFDSGLLRVECCWS